MSKARSVIDTFNEAVTAKQLDVTLKQVNDILAKLEDSALEKQISEIDKSANTKLMAEYKQLIETFADFAYNLDSAGGNLK